MATVQKLLESAYFNWNDAQTLGEVGSELESRSRLAEARMLLQRAIELNPENHPEWYLSLAWACFRDLDNLSGDGEKAITDGLEATDSNYLRASYIAFIEDDKAADAMIRDAADIPDLSVACALGFALLWRGHPDEALELLREIKPELPTDTAIPGMSEYVNAMIWLKGQGRDVDSSKEIWPFVDLLIAAKPQSYSPRALAIQLAQVERNWDAVIERGQDVLAIMPDEETTMFAVGKAYEKKNRDDIALLWYARAIGAKPSYGRARQSVAEICERKGQIDLADEYFLSIPQANPKWRMGRFALAQYLWRQERKEDALKEFRTAWSAMRPWEQGVVENTEAGRQMKMLAFPFDILS